MLGTDVSDVMLAREKRDCGERETAALEDVGETREVKEEEEEMEGGRPR